MAFGKQHLRPSSIVILSASGEHSSRNEDGVDDVDDSVGHGVVSEDDLAGVDLHTILIEQKIHPFDHIIQGNGVKGNYYSQRIIK